MSTSDLLMGDKISIIEYENLRFVIMDCPTNDNLRYYLKPLKANNVKHLVRVCEPTYSTQPLRESGIQVHELPFPDGQSPPSSVLNDWLDVIEEVDKRQKETGEKEAVAVHCVAGLGRAPVLVATALIEKGMKPLDAIEHIRKKRRGAFNNKQIQFLDTYKKRASKTLSIRKSFANMFKKGSGSSSSSSGGGSGSGSAANSARNSLAGENSPIHPASMTLMPGSAPTSELAIVASGSN